MLLSLKVLSCEFVSARILLSLLLFLLLLLSFLDTVIDGNDNRHNESDTSPEENYEPQLVQEDPCEKADLYITGLSILLFPRVRVRTGLLSSCVRQGKD